MAYTTAGNAGFRITTFTALGVTIKGMLRATLEKLVTRENIAAQENTPTARPVDEIDARVTADFLDPTSGVAETTAAGNCVASFSEADGSGSGGVTIGKTVASGITHNMAKRMGGHGVQQVFELEGSLTYTPTA